MIHGDFLWNAGKMQEMLAQVAGHGKPGKPGSAGIFQ
jgi:hypothetical protein